MPRVRCHFISVIMKTFSAIWYVIAMFVFSFFDIIRDLKTQALPSLAVILGLLAFFAVIFLVFLYNTLRWWKTHIYIEDDTLAVSRRQISQSKITVKLSEISTVNLQQNLLERLFNVYTLQLDINSSVTANKTDFNLVFDHDTAFAFRDYILKYSEGQAAADASDSDPHVSSSDSTPLGCSNISGSAVSDLNASGSAVSGSAVSGCSDISDSTVIIEFSFKETLRHCVLTFSFLGFLYTVTLLSILIFAIISDKSFGGSLVNLFFPMLLAIIPFIYKSLTAFLVYHNFVLKKSGNRLIVSYGLFTRKQFTLPLDKTNALVIKQPFQARFFNLCYGEIINVGMGDVTAGQSPIFCLLVKPETLQNIIRQIAPEFAAELVPEKSPKNALLLIMLKWELWAAVFSLSIYLSFRYLADISLWFVFPAMLLIFALCGFLSFTTKGLALYEDKISVTSGVLDKRTVTTAYGKLQKLSFNYGPLSSRFGIAKGSISILSSAINQNNAIGYFPKERFETIGIQMTAHHSSQNN